jgi:CRISPR/Cas system-associated exonuclease Cas4 (RecB family)
MTKNWKIVEPVEFFAENYYYLINGKKYWRVTQVKNVINKPGLNNWRARKDYKECQKYLHERANLGKKAHKLFQLKLQGNKINQDKYDNEIREDLILFDSIINNCKLSAEATEQHLWSDEFDIAGTADYIGQYKSCIDFLPKKGRGKNRKPVAPKFVKLSHVIGDWKTSPDIYDDFWLQLAAYAYMFEKHTGEKIDGGFIAQFRDGKVKIEEKTRSELNKYFEVMKHCIKVFEFTKGEF